MPFLSNVRGNLETYSEAKMCCIFFVQMPKNSNIYMNTNAVTQVNVHYLDITFSAQTSRVT